MTGAREVLRRHSSLAAAAAELGVTYGALCARFKTVGQTPGAHLAKVRVPEGMRVKSLTTGPRGTTTHADLATLDPPRFEAVPAGHLVKGVSTLLGPQGEQRAQWVKTDREQQQTWDAFWEAAEQHAKKYRGLVKRSACPKSTMADFMTAYPLGDPHVAMLSWARETGKDFDLKIVERDLVRAVGMLVARAPASKVGLLANVGDFFHIENDRQATPHGNNKLDGDGRLVKFVETGFGMMRRMVDTLLAKHARVIVANIRGNHDPMMACMLALWLREAYRSEPRVEVLDNVNPYLYVRHGKNLIGIAHGDGAKILDLGGIMATDRPSDWGETEFRYWLTGHIHQRKLVELPGCLAESFRTLATADFWAHWKGYRSGNSLCAITYDKRWGEVMRATLPLAQVRAA